MKWGLGMGGDAVEGEFVAEGRQLVTALCERWPERVRRVIVQRGRHEEVRERFSGLPIEERTAEEIRELAGYDFHRGILAVADRPEERELTAADCREHRRIAVAYELAAPENLGSLLRNACALGWDAVAVTRTGADPFARKALRAASTATFRLPLFRLPEPERWAELETAAVLAAASVDPAAVALEEVEAPRGPLLLFFGPEGPGLPEGVIRRCGAAWRIPMAGGFDSLNVASASAIFLHALSEAARGGGEESFGGI